MPEPTFDIEAAHKYFAADCFNGAWRILDDTSRSPDRDEELIAIGHASLWHWLKRPDRSDKNLAVAYWMLARIYSVTAKPERAKHYARLCADLTERAKLPAFYRGCAHEALARAFHAAGETEERDRQLAVARSIVVALEGDEQQILGADLDSIRA